MVYDWLFSSANNALAQIQNESGDHVLELDVSGGADKRYHLLSAIKENVGKPVVEFALKFITGSENYVASAIARANNEAIGSCYSLELRPYWTGAQWEVRPRIIKIEDGVRTLVAQDVSTYGNALVWESWRVRCYNGFENYPTIIFIFEKFDESDWQEAYRHEEPTSFLYSGGGLVGIGSFALSSDVNLQLRLNNMAVGIHYH